MYVRIEAGFVPVLRPVVGIGLGEFRLKRKAERQLLQSPVKTVLAFGRDLSNWVSGSKLWWVWVGG